jgi:hypothetical protein
MDLPTFTWLLETLRLAALVTGGVSATVGTVFYIAGKRAERRQRRRRGVWGS